MFKIVTSNGEVLLDEFWSYPAASQEAAEYSMNYGIETFIIYEDNEL